MHTKNTSIHIIDFFRHLSSPKVRTKDVEVLNPLMFKETQQIVKEFYSKFYNDSNKRIAFIGINPGRLGSGLTGIGFTDPINLSEHCGIENSFEKKHELSSKFIYEMIASFGGVKAFYNIVYITSVVPLGFVKNGVNLNYYDVKSLKKELLPYIKNKIEQQLVFLRRDVAFCIGKGKNYKFLLDLNEKEKYFNRIEVLPHPRWVMQYKLRQKHQFIEQYVTSILNACK